jgi:hypothetical protein
MKTSRDLQMFFAALTELVEGLSIETLPTLKAEKVSNLLSGYTETSNIHNRITFDFVLANVNKK